MGFGFRKSKNFGGIRFNLSKSGLGASCGVKGLRVSTNSKGTTLYAGKNGFYYRKKISSNKTNQTNQYNDEYFNIKQRETYSSYFHILKEVNEDFEYYIDKKEDWSSKDLKFLGKEVYGCLFISCLFIGIYFKPLFFITLLYGAYLKWKKFKLKIKINADSKLLDYTEQIRAIAKKTIMHNASTYEELQYGVCKVSNICDRYLPYINLNDYKLLFAENGVIFYSSDDIFLLPYQELSTEIIETVSYIIEPPKDAEIIESTYEHVNKNGSPNKKYKENRKVDKIRTWVIRLSSTDNITIPLAFFNKNLAQEYFDLLNKIKDQNIDKINNKGA